MDKLSLIAKVFWPSTACVLLQLSIWCMARLLSSAFMQIKPMLGLQLQPLAHPICAVRAHMGRAPVVKVMS